MTRGQSSAMRMGGLLLTLCLGALGCQMTGTRPHANVGNQQPGSWAAVSQIQQRSHEVLDQAEQAYRTGQRDRAARLYQEAARNTRYLTASERNRVAALAAKLRDEGHQGQPTPDDQVIRTAGVAHEEVPPPQLGPPQEQPAATVAATPRQGNRGKRSWFRFRRREAVAARHQANPATPIRAGSVSDGSSVSDPIRQAHHLQVQDDPVVHPAPLLPRELHKVMLPDYIIEPPDILLIDALQVIPKPPYRIAPLDTLLIEAPFAFPSEPIAGFYTVEPDGTVNLGLLYGKVAVSGLTIEEARKPIRDRLTKKDVKNPETHVALAEARGAQQVRGEHLVRPDGTVSLGTYGSVAVAGLTLEAARHAIEAHLSQTLLKPEVSVDVLAYNSKVYYVIFDGGGIGQQILRLPVTGNDTVLDALSQVNGLPAFSSKHRIWVARPSPAGDPHDHIMPVDWNAITKRGRTETNYQLVPGDRIYVQAQGLISVDYYLSLLFTPFERAFGVILLGDGLFDSLRVGAFGGGFGPTGF